MTAFTIHSQDLSVDAVAALRVQSLRTDPNSFGEKLETAAARSREAWEDWLEERANGKDRMIFVLISGARYEGMCGAAIQREDTGAGFVWGVYVAPELRGKGGADLLLEAAHAWLRERGVKRVTAKVAAKNSGAMSFYQRIGYEFLPHVKPTQEGQLECEHTFELNLARQTIE